MGTLMAQIVSRDDSLPQFDIHCPLLSLPLAFGTRLETIPSKTPYLRPPPRAVQHWQTRLGPRDRLRIGVCWAGNPSFRGDLNRSIGLAPMLPLLANADVEFFSLQKDLRTGDAEILRDNRNIAHLEIETFSDTAAIISLMDLVISSDTSVVHLAGALGKPIWILLQFVPDWRWLLDREDSPWYPTARLFRQDDSRTWTNVMKRVETALVDYVRSHEATR
jgi:ADP-heptose:LPS heptosyltransferase